MEVIPTIKDLNRDANGLEEKNETELSDDLRRCA